jgi:chromate transporter
MIRGVFSGLRPVVIGLIASAALLLINAENFGDTSSELVVSITIAALSLATVLFTKIHPILVIILAGIAGLCIYY